MCLSSDTNALFITNRHKLPLQDNDIDHHQNTANRLYNIAQLVISGFIAPLQNIKASKVSRRLGLILFNYISLFEQPHLSD